MMRTVKELTKEELEVIVNKTIEAIVDRELCMDEALCVIADVLMDNSLLDLSR